MVPWQVALLRVGGTNIATTCGGVLLSNEHILTAAHCKPHLSLNGDDRALVGAKSVSETDRIHILSRRYYVHEEYETFTSERYGFIAIFDFMILFLQNPLSMRCPTSFVRLPKQNDDSPDNLLNKPLITVGWGSYLPVTHQQLLDQIQNGVPYPMANLGELRQIEVSYVPKSICQLRWQELISQFGATQGVHPHPELPGILDKPGKHYANLLRFDEEPGHSMLCASACTTEDLSKCEHRHERRGVCVGDSGCKYVKALALSDFGVQNLYSYIVTALYFVLMTNSWSGVC